MTSIVDNLKDAFKYPLYDCKKIGILAILYFLLTSLSLISENIALNIIQPTTTFNPFFKILIMDLNLQQATLTPSTNLIFLIIITIISILIGILTYGYLYNITESTMKGKNDLPKINSYKKMSINGLKITIITFIYSIGIIILLWINLKIISLSAPYNLGTIGLISTLIFIILSLIIVFFGLLSIMNMIKKEGKLTSAFKFSEISELISQIGWIRTFGAIIISNFANLTILLSGMILLTIILIFLSYWGINEQIIQILIGSIILFVLISYCSIALSRFYGLIYREIK